MKARRALPALALAAAAATLPLAAPASAVGVTATTAGTVLTVNIVGGLSVQFDCGGGNVRVNYVQAAPALACSALTRVNANGDGAGQFVNGANLNVAAFSANPYLVANLGDGNDWLSETDQADQIQMSGGDDQVLLSAPGPDNTSVTLSAGSNDRVTVAGTAADETLTATSTSSSLSVAITGPSAATRTATGAEYLVLSGNQGDDSLTTTAVTAASTIDDILLEGGDGDDTLTDGAVDSSLYGGNGTNLLRGGGGRDAYWSSSETDTLDGGGDTVGEFLYDSDGLRSGGRTLTGFTALDTWTVQAHTGDVVMRVRPPASPGGATILTTSLIRTGQQLVPASIGKIALGQSYVGAVPHKGIADVVAGAQAVNATLPSDLGGLLDVTIPSGSWSTTVTGSNVSVATGTYGIVTASFVADHRVHGPWTNKDQGFAHRAHRDLLFRFPTNAARDSVRNQLAGGTLTRAQHVRNLTATDEYRGLDVDRVFAQFLRRVADPGGRTYWINSLRSGKALWRFRAQLIGSDEYYLKFGGTDLNFVRQAYRDVLGRDPDPSGAAYWAGKLSAGVGRGSVALQFINSPEEKRSLVTEQFLRFLDRAPTTTELNTWVPQLTAAGGEQALIRFLAASSAYYDRS